MQLGRTFTREDGRHDGNIFNLLRLFFAWSVIVSHAYVLTGRPFDDPTLPLLPFPLGRVAVLAFFSLSGFLVTNSMLTRGARQFALARGLRLLPGLWAMLIVTSIVLAPFALQPLADYATGAPWLRYVLQNGLLMGRRYSIPGVFPDNPVPGLVNGSLWSIPREVQCYVLLVGLALTGILSRRRLLTAGYLLFCVVHLVVPRDLIPALTDLRELSLSFFAGALLWLWRDRVPLSWVAVVAIGAIAWALPAGPLRGVLSQWNLAYGIIVVGVLAPAGLKRLATAMPDYSYGVYIYAFPAQQVTIVLGWGVTPGMNVLVASLLTLPFAALSWHLVEKPANGLKGRIGAHRSAAGA